MGNDADHHSAETIFGQAFGKHPTPAGIVRLQDVGIVAVNEAWVDMMGIAREEAIGRTHHGLGIMESPMRHQVRGLVSAGGSFTITDATIQTRSSGDRRVHVAIQILPLEGDTFVTYTMVDHTEESQAFDDLERAHRELKAAETARLQLLSGVAHDMANPLTPIRTHLYVLKKRGLVKDPELREAFTAISRNVEQLALFVRDLRDFAKMEAQRFELRKEPVDLAPLTNEVVGSMGVVFEAHEIRLKTRVAPAIPVEADPLRITQVLVNLIGNAAKFTKPGGFVEIDATVEADEARVRVRDSGPGLDKNQLERLFKPFSQVHDPAAADPGMGLGLFICRQIVDLHGGRIGADSPGRGKGSEFWFSLPAR